jgi:hypothetical protein
MTNNDEKLKPRGLIRFVFLAVSHPDIQPTAQQMSAFIMEKLPEFEKQPNGTAKIGLLCETKSMNLIDIYSLAMETFGNEVSDESKYTYRTMHFGIDGGEAKCLVIYDIASVNS